MESGKVKYYLRDHPDVVRQNILLFEEEISYLGKRPVLVAMGGETFRILKENLGDKYTIVQFLHYSFIISKENYRQKVLDVLDDIK